VEIKIYLKACMALWKKYGNNFFEYEMHVNERKKQVNKAYEI